LVRAHRRRLASLHTPLPSALSHAQGRLIDHLRNSQGFGLEDLACLVLDEADRLLEMGFADEVSEILRLAPAKRQTLLFSATMTDEVRALAALSLRHPVRLAADAAAAAPAALTQEVVRLKGGAAAGKEAALLALAARSLAPAGARAIVFFRTKQRAHRARIVFGLAGLPPAAELHGDMSQAARLEALERFRRGEASFLLATDVAARGLDILGVDTVVNYDCPRTLEAYLHRVGRTARAGGRGRSVTFVEDGDRGLLRDVVRRARAALTRRALPAAAVAGWQARVEALEPEVARVVGEEAEERALRRAEMEAQKASNMVEHEAEIAARPARTWFQSGTQKRDSAARAKEAAAAEGAAAAGEAKGKDKSAKRQERKAAAAKEAAEAARQKGRGKLMEETAAVTGKVRAAKVRAQALQREGMPASLAGRMAAAQAAGVKKKQRKASAAANGGKKAVGADDAGGGLFSGDGVTRGGPESAAVLSGRGAGTQVYAGGARSGVPKKPPSAAALSGSALSKAKRAGKGRHSFKSKGRHNRRKK
jgi:ATP-dependent RNA helicase DDX27